MLQWNGTAWVNVDTPAGSVTSVALETGTNNGTIHVKVNGVAQADVSVKGLGSLAYKSSLATSDIPDLSGVYQPLDSDLTAIAALTGPASGSAFLKRKSDDTWELDTTAYLTGNQTIELSGDITGSGATSIVTTIGDGKVTNAMLAGNIAISKIYGLEGNLATISSALQSLQAQIDSAATIGVRDELAANVIFADTLSASNVYAENINFGWKTIGGEKQPMYVSSGALVASSSTEGSASLPVYLNAGTITACTGSSLFSHLGSNTLNNIEIIIAGQLRYLNDIYAKYDGVGGTIAEKYLTDFSVSQSSYQVSVKKNGSWSHFTVPYATIATYDGDGEIIGNKFGTVGLVLQSLQSQIDSVAARHGFDSINATNAFFDMVSVGSCIYAGALVTTSDQSISSDETLKVNLKDIELSAEEIAKARAVTFDWKDGHGSSFGTIAQDWKDILPQSVLGANGGYSFAYAQAGTVIGVSNAREIVRLKERVKELEEQLRLR